MNTVSRIKEDHPSSTRDPILDSDVQKRASNSTPTKRMQIRILFKLLIFILCGFRPFFYLLGLLSFGKMFWVSSATPVIVVPGLPKNRHVLDYVQVRLANVQIGHSEKFN